MIRLVILCLLCAGCLGTKRDTQSIERRVGTEAGQPTDLTITKQTRSAAEVVVPPATQGALGGLLGMLGGVGGVGGLVFGVQQWLRSRELKRDADEGWKLAQEHALKRPPPEA